MKEFTITFHIYEGVDGRTYFTEKYQEVRTGLQFWRYGFRNSDDEPWTEIKEGLRSKPNLKRMNLIK